MHKHLNKKRLIQSWRSYRRWYKYHYYSWYQSHIRYEIVPAIDKELTDVYLIYNSTGKKQYIGTFKSTSV